VALDHEMKQPSPRSEPSSNAHVSRNVAKIATAKATADERVSRHQHLIERLTLRLGQPATIYTATAAIVAWLGVNLALPLTGRHALDAPPFFWLQSATTCLALIVAFMVLTTQNRQAREAEKRSELDLQINLLSEQKLAKVIALLEELRRDMPSVRDREDAVAHAMTQSVDPHAVILALEETLEGRDSAADNANEVASAGDKKGSPAT
jgi:uncharacterized membrane protein